MNNLKQIILYLLENKASPLLLSWYMFMIFWFIENGPTHIDIPKNYKHNHFYLKILSALKYSLGIEVFLFQIQNFYFITQVYIINH